MTRVTKRVIFELAEGQTGQANVIGTGFTAYPNGKIKFGKIKKKRLKEEEYESECDCDCDTCSEKCLFEDLTNSPNDDNAVKLDEKLLNVVKRDGKWCVVHGHPDTGGARDKPIGSIIHCYPGTDEGRKQAYAMHWAIIKSEERRRNGQ